MKRTLIIILGIITLTFTVSAKAQSDTLPEVKTSDAFKQLQGIIGKWKGKLTKDNGVVVSIESEYSLTSNGSAIVEKPNKLQSYYKVIDTDKSIVSSTSKLTRVK